MRNHPGSWIWQLMALHEKYKANFVELASRIVGSFSLGQEQLSDVLRNIWGKYLSSVHGVNVVPTKALIVESSKTKKQELTQLIGLEIQVYDEMPDKFCWNFRSRTQGQNSGISVYWHGISTTCLKVVECHNLNRLTIIAGDYLGPEEVLCGSVPRIQAA